MMVAEAHDEMEDSHCMDYLRVAFSAWMELLRVPLVDEIILTYDD